MNVTLVHATLSLVWEMPAYSNERGYQMKPGTKSTIWTAIWGAVGGAVATIVIGFAWGGWTTAGVSKNATEEALLASRAAICVAQFMNQPDHQEKLDELRKIDSYVGSWKRANYIKKGGWDKMPGQEVATSDTVSRACADGLELLMKK